MKSKKSKKKHTHKRSQQGNTVSKKQQERQAEAKEQ